jgi:hypothetical protein
MMTALLLASLLLQAGRLQPGTGIVTGAIRMSGGGAAPGVRVGAVAIDDPAGTNLVSIAETDSAGRYRLTNIPQGQYYIVAGRVTSLTYYPGGNDASKAKQVAVEPARIVSNVDFVVPTDSRRPVSPPPRPPGASQVEQNAYHLALSQKTPHAKMSALLAMEKAYPRSPLMPEVYVALADMYATQKDAVKTAEYSQKALKLNPDNVTALIYVSRDYATRLGDLRLAMQYAERAVTSAAKLRGQTPRYLYNVAAWQSWTASMESSAKSNLQWIRQLSAQQQSVLSDMLRRR